MELEPGLVVDDKYLLLEQIGEGQSARVFMARELLIDRVVALKFFKQDLYQTEQSRARFEQEAKVLALLVHPNIITFYRLGFHLQTPFLVVEYCDGTSLTQRIRSENGISVPDCIEIAITICGAMGVAHQHGIVHRDLKPDNILIPRSGDYRQLRIVDFGIAKMLLTAAEQQGLTSTGQILGSLAYMSPEQCKTGKADARSDIYSLCCLLFEMLCGEPPFGNSCNSGEIIQHHASSKPPLISARRTKTAFPRELEALINRGLSKSPDARPQSMEEFQLQLQAVAEHTPVSMPDANLMKLGAKNRAWLLGVFALTLSIGSIIFYERRQPSDFKTLNESTSLSSQKVPMTASGCIKQAMDIYYNNQPSRNSRFEQSKRIIELSSVVIALNRTAPDLQTMYAFYLRACARRRQVSRETNTAAIQESVERDLHESVRYATLPDKRVYVQAYEPLQELARMAVGVDDRLALKYWQKALDAAKNGVPTPLPEELVHSGIPSTRSAMLHFERQVLNSQYAIGNTTILPRARDLIVRWSKTSPGPEHNSPYLTALLWLAGLYNKQELFQQRDAVLQDCCKWLETGEQEKVTDLWIQVGMAFETYGFSREARRCFEKAVACVANREPTLYEAEALMSLSKHDQFEGRFPDAVAHAEQALKSQTRVGRNAAAQNFWRCDFLHYQASFRNGDEQAAAGATSLFTSHMARPPVDKLNIWFDSGEWLASVADLRQQLTERDALMNQLEDRLKTEVGRMIPLEIAGRYLAIASQWCNFGYEERASSALQKAIDRAPDIMAGRDCRFRCRFMLAQLEEHTAKYERAAACWRMALQDVNSIGLSPQLVVWYKKLLQCRIQCNEILSGEHQALKDLELLVAELEKSNAAYNFNVNFMETCVSVARAFAFERQFARRDQLLAQAEAHVERGSMLPPQSADEARLVLAVALMEAGRTDAAMKHVRSAVGNFKKYPVRQYNPMHRHLMMVLAHSRADSKEQAELMEIIQLVRKISIV